MMFKTFLCVLLVSLSIFKQVSDNYTEDIGETSTTHIYAMIHPTCKKECPSACSNEWEFYPDYRGMIDSDDVQRIDKSINVSCGMI